MELNSSIIQNNETGKFIPWNFATKPSMRARKLIEELHRQGRDDFGICGPSVEFRDGFYWIDICYHIESDNGSLIKYAIEVDDEHHDDPIQQGKDKKKDRYLKSNGWMVRRIHHSEFDAKDIKELAEDILFQVYILKMDCGDSRQ